MKWQGLSTQEAQKRLQTYGPNILPEEKQHPLVDFVRKFWAPVPWMLEMIILLECGLGKFLEAAIIVALLLFNAGVSFFEEGKAKNALHLLRKRLSIQVRALRDGQWRLLPAEALVPEDVIHLRMGDILAADSQLLEGALLVDQSAITGESLPVEPKGGVTLYAGSTVCRGEADAKVLATGKNTRWGQTAEIMRLSKTPSHLQQLLFSIVKSLVVFDAVLVAAVFTYCLVQGLPLFETIPFSLLLLVASVPVALPATYALSTALGSIELAKAGVLVTRLSAIEEAASMNILCVDKTGTITQNALKVSKLHSYLPYTDDDLLHLAAMACKRATQDPMDLAILQAREGRASPFSAAEKLDFIPFDPEKKYAECLISYHSKIRRVLKGAPSALLQRVSVPKDCLQEIERLSLDGSRILATVFETEDHSTLVGLIALQDPPLETSKAALQEIQKLGVKVIMMTGDSLATARSIAEQVGIGAKAIAREELLALAEEKIASCDIIAGIFPEDKFHIIERLQKQKFICGMTGDGVNDAPALKKAEVGIAVKNATDVAKAASSLVLTRSGLTTILEAIKCSRRIYQRMLTYVLNKIIKTLSIAVLLGVGLFVTKSLILSQLLIILLLFANDFSTMSIATDRVSYSPFPDKWNIQKLTMVGGVFAFLILGLCFFLLFVCQKLLDFSLEELQTGIFLLLVFIGQATLYLVRERNHFWHSCPSFWMIGLSLFNIGLFSLMAMHGFLMAPLPASFVIALLAIVLGYFVLLDWIKVKVFQFFKI